MPGSLQETAALIEQRGRRAAVVPLDLTDRASVKEAAQSALSAFGWIDVLVNVSEETSAKAVVLCDSGRYV
jgi:NAD(P)-dependent dehydrogenase (short-subunit alcohol dehydrogenase family)